MGLFSAILGIGKVLAPVIGGAIGSKKASDAQQNALQAAINKQQEMYDSARTDLLPWLSAGQQAVGQLQKAVGSGGFKASPGYQFRINEGVKAQNRAASANGSLNTMAHKKALNLWGQRAGSEEYGNWMNQLGYLSGSGQQAGSTIGSLGYNTGRDIAGHLHNRGIARSSGYGNMAQIGLDGGDQLSRYIAGANWGGGGGGSGAGGGLNDMAGVDVPGHF
jgi:hypothetical protein